MERPVQKKAQKQIVIVSSSSYFSDGTTTKQKKIAYINNSNGERGQAVFVNKKGSQTQAQQTSDVEVVKRHLGIGTKPPQKKRVHKPQRAQKKSNPSQKRS